MARAARKIHEGIVVKFNYRKPGRIGVAMVKNVGEVALTASTACPKLIRGKKPRHYPLGEEPVLPKQQSKVRLMISGAGKDLFAPFWTAVLPAVRHKRSRR